MGIFADMVFIIGAFITRGVRNNQLGRQFQPADKFNSMFNGFALNDARWLKDEVFALVNIEVGAHGVSVGIGSGWWGVEVHHIGDHTRGQAVTRSELLGLDRVDDHMSNGWQMGRKGSGKIIAYAIDLKTLALPMKIMVVCDGGITRLGDEFCDGETQWQVEGDRHGVFDDENF